MNQELQIATKKIADTLIDISTKLADNMDSWNNVVVGEGSLRPTDRAGFVNKTSADSGIDLVIDTIALKDSNEAVLRTWALSGTVGVEGSKVFDNIQLTFAVNHQKTRALTERFDSVTRDDIRNLLHETDTMLQAVVVANHWGLSETAQVVQGKYYDLAAHEIVEQGLADEVRNTLETVLEALQHAADTELSRQS